jgi:hypothetical protein
VVLLLFLAGVFFSAAAFLAGVYFFSAAFLAAMVDVYLIYN